MLQIFLHSDVVLFVSELQVVFMPPLCFSCLSQISTIEKCLQSMIDMLNSGKETNRWVYATSLKEQIFAETLGIIH